MSESNIPNDNMINRSVFFISDGTAITAETLGHSLLAQFPNVEFDTHIMPYIDSEESAMNVVMKINTRKILSGIAEIVGETERITDITVAIDKMDKIEYTDIS